MEKELEGRVRDLEINKAGCDQKFKNYDQDISEIKDGVKWGTRYTIATLITVIIMLISFIGAQFFAPHVIASLRGFN